MNILRSIFGRLARIEALLATIDERTRTMSEQQNEIDAVVTEIQGDVTALGTAVAAVQAEIDRLVAAQTAGTPLDLTALQAAASALAPAVQAVTALGAENPAPPAA